MGFIKELGETIKNLTEFEKIGIFCFSVIVIILIINKMEYSFPLILYSIAIILLFLYAGLHKTKSNKTLPHPTKPNEFIDERIEGYDFNPSVKNKKHPYNIFKNISFFFLFLTTIFLVIEFFK